MAFTCRETAENVFYRARLHAAEKDTAFESRISAGALVGIMQLYAKGGARMENQKEGLIGFDPVKFIELLLKLDGNAKGQTLEVKVWKQKDKKDEQIA